VGWGILEDYKNLYFMDAIVIENLSKKFKDLVVLDGINFTVPKGTMLALLGPNGAGKTTTIKILSTLLQPDSGHAIVGGFDVAQKPENVRGLIGLTGQYAAVDELLNGRENLYMMGQLYHLKKGLIKERAEALLKQFDLAEAANRPVKTYSGGMRRRLDLALSLIATPPIIFLDEPTTGLDPRSRLLMWDIIRGLLKDGSTILLTTQYLEEADNLADKIAVLDKGKIIAQGAPKELKTRVGTERIEIIVEQKSNFQKAVQLITGDDLRQNAEERSISVSTDGSVKEVKRVLDILNEAGIEIDAMSVRTPTLDDVFLHFTGKEAE